MIGGYQAGVCRTAMVQRAPPHAERIWQHMVECKYLMMEMIKPRRQLPRDLRCVHRKARRAANLPPISFVGHGIGLHLHEDPYLGKTPILGKTGDAELEAGMVLGVEPLCYQTGLRLRRAEQGHDAGDGDRLRVAVRLRQYGQADRHPVATLRNDFSTAARDRSRVIRTMRERRSSSGHCASSAGG